MLNEAKMPGPRPKLYRGRGQNHVAEDEVNAKSSRPRPKLC